MGTRSSSFGLLQTSKFALPARVKYVFFCFWVYPSPCFVLEKEAFSNLNYPNMYAVKQTRNPQDHERKKNMSFEETV